MTPEERQRARDRAADAIAPRELVTIAPEGWPSPLRGDLLGLGPTARRRVHRARAKAARS